MNKRIIVTLALIFVIFAGLIIFSKINNEQNSGVGSQGSENLYGKLDSPVILTEYVDFQCEACAAYYPTMKEVKEKYKDSVRFEIKNFPIATSHANARAAAAAAQAAAKQNKFFEMHDMLFERQQAWSNLSGTERSGVFESYANEIGLDMNQFSADVTSDETQGIIQADLAEVKKLGGNGTPTFALNGEKIENPDNSVEAISAVLDKALLRAGQ